MKSLGLIIWVFLLMYTIANAETVEYDLDISYGTMNFTGRDTKAMTINGGIPGPVLRFKEGDTARIRVHNKMDVDTSVHWHGILVPPGMDGVPYISFPPIKPHATFTYEFPIRQSGTYWYHSHSGFQEQRGVYGAIVIESKEADKRYDKDYVIVLSDWIDENPHEVLRTLKRGSEWYALQKGSAQSILGAARIGRLGDYFKRELLRMPPMDIADVAYDRFLANGNTFLDLEANPGETIRLRIIDGSATTFFYLEFSGGPMMIISADGQSVEPLQKQRFLIGVAETYDVLVKIPESGSYELRATAHDGSAYTTVWLGSGHKYSAPDIPKPDVYYFMGGLKFNQVFALTPAGTMGMSDRDVRNGKFDKPGMLGMESMDAGHMHHMNMGSDPMPLSDMGGNHDSHNMNMIQSDSAHVKKETSITHGQEKSGVPGNAYGYNFGFLAADASATRELAIDGMSLERPGMPYKDLRALRSTVFSQSKPVREIRFTLDGDMKRYVWLINNKPLSESDVIRIKEGEVVRFIMINRTMMHHPMHLHGHFFRVINTQGDYSPLKHTVDVEPMSTTVIEFDAEEVGDWFFHCHLLYHMMSGMARVVHYEDFQIEPELAANRPKLHHDEWYLFGTDDALSNMNQGSLTVSNTRNIFSAEWEYGWQGVKDNEWEGIFTWNYYINRFFSVLAGVDILGIRDEADNTRGIAGFGYLLPFNFETRTWVDSDGGARVTFGRSFELTPRVSLFGEVEYDTHDKWEEKAGVTYLVNKNFSLIGQWHSEYGAGGGVRIRF